MGKKNEENAIQNGKCTLFFIEGVLFEQLLQMCVSIIAISTMTKFTTLHIPSCA